MPDRNKPDKLRPLADPKRSRYVRQALNRKQWRAEREALDASHADPERHANNLRRIRELSDLLGE